MTDPTTAPERVEAERIAEGLSEAEWKALRVQKAGRHRSAAVWSLMGKGLLHFRRGKGLIPTPLGRDILLSRSSGDRK